MQVGEVCIQFAAASIYSASDFPVIDADDLSSTDGEEEDREEEVYT